MISKALTLWLLVLVSYGSAGPRIKRVVLKPTLSFSELPAPPYPIYKVHRYTGVQLQPLESPYNDQPMDSETPSIESDPDYPVSEPEEPEEEDSSSGLGSILSFVPGGLTGLLSLSASSFKNQDDTGDEEERTFGDRSGLIGLKKDILTTILQKKKEALSALKRDAIQLVIRKAKAKKAWVKNLLFGSGHPGYYSNAPYYYTKKASVLSYLPFVGHWFSGGTQLPEVKLPNVPNLVALKEPSHLPVIDLHAKYQFPYQSSTYLKVDYPDKDKPVLSPELEYQVPSTAYGVPESPVSVPQLPYYENAPSSSSVTTAAPEAIAQEVYPYAPESPQPAQNPAFPYSAPYPYPPESYPYEANDYYDTAQSEIRAVKEVPVYRHSKEPIKTSKAENRIQGRLDQVDGSDSGDNIEEDTKTNVPR